MKKKTQILMIHGGSTFKNKTDYLHFLKSMKVSIKERIKWSDDYLDKKLGKDFEIIRPRMPLAQNAKYREWKILFEKYIPLLRKNTILIGSSLGGIFLAKYLSENKFPRKILSLYLIAPPFDNAIPGEDLVGGFKLKADLSLIEKNSSRVYLLFSGDDKSIPLSHAEKYKKKLRNAKIIIYRNKKGHFKISRFPEIVRMIKRDTKNFHN